MELVSIMPTAYLILPACAQVPDELVGTLATFTGYRETAGVWYCQFRAHTPGRPRVARLIEISVDALRELGYAPCKKQVNVHTQVERSALLGQGPQSK